jgi:CxxC motif-containing protein (DUF1111 family)
MTARRAALALATLAACDGAPRAPAPGGDTTVADRTSNAYSLPAPNLAPAELDRHLAGDVGFDATFVRGPAPINPGLGPLYNHNACAACHGKDGRGLPMFAPTGSQALVRVSLADGTPELPGAPVPVPGLGGQLQDHGVFGVPAEVAIELAWTERTGRYGDGTPYQLRAPTLALRHPDGGALDPAILISFRQAPAVFGLGLLEAIPDAALEAAADPADRDGDGISGRVNRVWDVDAGAVRIGRFGHKAGNPTLVQQAAAAYANDMGVTSRRFGGDAEVDDAVVAATAFYTATLGVPARAPGDVVAGEARFDAFGCGACHTPLQTSGAAPDRRARRAGRSRRTPICCCTTSAPTSPISARSSRPTAASGARRRCGGSAWWRRCCPAPATCTTAARARSPRRSCGTAARPRPPASASAPRPPPSAPSCCASCRRCDGAPRAAPSERRHAVVLDAVGGVPVQAHAHRAVDRESARRTRRGRPPGGRRAGSRTRAARGG